MVLRRPCKVLTKTKEGFREIPSIFRFKSDYKTFMNSWNIKQVIFIEGSLDITTRLDTLIKIVQSTDLVPHISPTDLGKIRVLDLEDPKCVELHDKIMTINEKFNSLMKKLVLPLRISMMALLSARKCTIFDDSLCNLMECVLNYQYEGITLY
jgi:hypothetical protein